jgi:hypothetical protein
MFNPTRDQARTFLFDVWEKHAAGAAMTPLEQVALAAILEHPEYHAVLRDRERYLEREWKPEGGEPNPFLHLQMHIAIEEQLSIDSPPGIRDAVQALARRHGSMHDARHDVMDCLAEMIWNAQRHGTALDNGAYLDCLAVKTRQA